MKSSTIVQKAEIPATKSNNNNASGIFDRHCYHGGPVTVATIRFPPPLRVATEAEETSSTDEVYNNNTQRSKGRIILARGPWIESHPLFPTYKSTLENDVDSTDADDDDECYKILAFGEGANHGSSTIESVHGMIFPSSSNTSKSTNSKWSSKSSSLISVIAYGGRKLSFLTGGGLWNTTFSYQSCKVQAVESSDNGSFASMSILKNEKKIPYLETSDWIHDVRLLDVNPSAKNGSSTQQEAPAIVGSFLIAMGMANNNVDIWGFHIMTTASSTKGRELVLSPTRLQCILCNVRCMTYSLSFFGWNNEHEEDSLHINDDSSVSSSLPSLVVASGTVFGDIIVWGANINNNQMSMEHIDNNSLDTAVQHWIYSGTDATKASTSQTSRIRVTTSSCLKGHLGSVFSVKFSTCGKYIASTSDDRSVRLWARTTNRSDFDHDKEGRLNADTILSKLETSQQIFDLVWTGWGHTARVWDVSFASPSPSSSSSLPLLVSAGEDSTARIWIPSYSSSKKESVHPLPLRGHRCESLWTVDVCDQGIIVTGGNDGCVKLFDLESRVKIPGQEGHLVRKAVVPHDPATSCKSITMSGGEEDGSIVQQPMPETDETNKTSDSKEQQPPKKRKKKKVKKSTGQAICGMQFYSNGVDSVQSKLLVATRAGGLFSVDLINSAWTDLSSWSEQVVNSSSDSKAEVTIDPSSGSCLGVHPSGRCAIVGTTSSWLVASSLCSDSTPKKTFAFQAGPSYRPAQSISFIDDNNLLVFYARGSVVWFKFGQDASAVPLHVMVMGTNGIPLSFAYDYSDQSMHIGDSRGNISSFDVSIPCKDDSSSELVEAKPCSVLTKVHDKEHVTSMTVQKSSHNHNIIVSVGNDGCMTQCKKNERTGQLEKMISIPIPNVTGLRDIWNVTSHNGKGELIIGGYYGNDYVLLDSINGYEFLRIPTGGRQRRNDFFFSFASKNIMASLRCPYVYGMAILTGQKDSQSEIDLHVSHSFKESLAMSAITCCSKGSIQTPYSIGSPVHAETINDLCFVESCGSTTYLLTGSNDCTVKLSRLGENKVVSAMELPPHESCVRGVCSSRHPNSCSSLLVTCGGKLSMEFYQFSPATSNHDRHGMNCSVSLLCSYRTLGKATIDHRMNAVRAIPLLPEERKCHMVVAGDSDGNMHLCIVPEQATARRTIIGTILEGNGRPILCLELLRYRDKILAFAGTTGGEISVWVFPGRLGLNENGDEVPQLDGSIPEAPIHVYEAHQRGVNDLAIADLDRISVVVCSVGDDQTLSACILEFTYNEETDTLQQCAAKECCTLITTCASASALKAVKVILEEKQNDIPVKMARIYTTGHDERITLWHFEASSTNMSVKYLTSSSLATEGSCVDCIHIKQTNGSISELLAVGGEGIELQSIDLSVLHAAIKLRQANYLLITTGAGFSADSGLQTYECAPVEYRDMCNPAKLTEDPRQFQQFWLEFTKSYLQTSPHNGYQILDEWCHGGRLKHLSNKGSPWWVYSSNVDGHFCLFESFHDTLCGIHGSALEYTCACGIGYSDGEPRLGKEWNQWNEEVKATQSCKETIVQMNESMVVDIDNSDEVYSCEHCKQPMRPNVLMFHDTDDNVLRPISVQRERYQTWEAQVEDEVAKNGGKLVILEMGCGVNVPAVRQESEEVLLDCAAKIEQTNKQERGSVCLIRINPKDSEIKTEGEGIYETISISSKAATALYKIDRWLRTLA